MSIIAVEYDFCEEYNNTEHNLGELISRFILGLYWFELSINDENKKAFLVLDHFTEKLKNIVTTNQLYDLVYYSPNQFDTFSNIWPLCVNIKPGSIVITPNNGFYGFLEIKDNTTKIISYKQNC